MSFSIEWTRASVCSLCGCVSKETLILIPSGLLCVELECRENVRISLCPSVVYLFIFERKPTKCSLNAVLH